MCEDGRQSYLIKIGTFFFLFNQTSLVIYFSGLMADMRVQDKFVDTEVSISFYCTYIVSCKYLQKCFYLENLCHVN